MLFNIFNNKISVVDLYVDQALFYCSAAELFGEKKKVCKEEKIKEIVQVGHKETSRGHKVVKFSVTCRLLHT